MPGPDTIERAMNLALQALVWTLESPARAERLLALTGLSPAELRGGAGEPGVLAAILAFLEAHETDLVACAEALDERPEALVAARRALEEAA
jgi:hypothetical protein